MKHKLLAPGVYDYPIRVPIDVAELISLIREYGDQKFNEGAMSEHVSPISSRTRDDKRYKKVYEKHAENILNRGIVVFLASAECRHYEVSRKESLRMIREALK